MFSRHAAALCTTLAELECRLAVVWPAFTAGDTWLVTLTTRALQLFFLVIH
jgi:hypothetical protein